MFVDDPEELLASVPLPATSPVMEFPLVIACLVEFDWDWARVDEVSLSLIDRVCWSMTFVDVPENVPLTLLDVDDVVISESVADALMFRSVVPTTCPGATMICRSPASIPRGVVASIGKTNASVTAEGLVPFNETLSEEACSLDVIESD